MSMFMEDEEKTLNERTSELYEKLDSLLTTAFRASGGTVMSALKGMNKDNGALLGEAVELYEQTIEFATAYARCFDQMREDMTCMKDELTEIRRELSRIKID